MWEQYEDVWDEQIGYNVKVAHDFSGREIHKEDFGNPNSPFGWTLLPFPQNDSFLVVHNKTMAEFPENTDGEFIINGKIFEIQESVLKNGSLDINQVTYETTEERRYRLARENTQQVPVGDSEGLIKLKQKMQDLEQKYQNSIFAANQASDKNQQEQVVMWQDLSQKFQQQEQQLQALKANQANQEEKIRQQNQQILELEKTATINLQELERKNHEIANLKQKNTVATGFNKTPIPQATQALQTQPQQQIEKKQQNWKETGLNNNNNTSSFRVFSPTQVAGFDPLGEWEHHYGDRLIATDFAGKVMVKTEFGKNNEGGWGIDHYTDQKADGYFICSLYSIAQRKGQSQFIIDGKEYQIVVRNGQRMILDRNIVNHSLYSQNEIDNQVQNLAPVDVKKFNGTYESYASLLINLNHFPVDYLDRFEAFLRHMVSDLPVYKDLFMYLNKRAYESGNSNITSYARIFWKFASTKEEIEILMVVLSLKNALIQFVNNYRSKNHRYVVSFSMVLSNHKRQFRFIQAQTNYDILRTAPVPFKIPLYKMILDKEFNSVLQYHENELWKKLKPFAIDHEGQTYYICDLDPKEYLDQM